MNRVAERASETQPQEKRWFATTRTFLEIPNPAVFKVFVISSLATLTSGVALGIEWISHGKSHAGFKWIIYYALFLICLPLVIWIGLRIFMAISGSSQVAAKEETQPSEEERENNSCRSLAVVVESDERKKKEEKMPRIKRAVSFPSHGGVRSCRTR